MFDAGSSISAACQSGEREGATPHIPEGVADGEHRPQTHELELFPHGKSLDSVVLTLIESRLMGCVIR